MTWTIYLASVVGFWAALTMTMLDENPRDDGDYWPTLLIVVPLVSMMWPLLILPLIVVNGLSKLERFNELS